MLNPSTSAEQADVGASCQDELSAPGRGDVPGPTVSTVGISLRLHQRAGRTGARRVQRRKSRNKPGLSSWKTQQCLTLKVKAEFAYIGSTRQSAVC